jgi:hypothetical protein
LLRRQLLTSEKTMHRLAVLAAAGIVIAAMSPADAASRHKHKVRATPVATQRAPVQPAVANRPVWAAPQQCYTDDGYGRFLPCDLSDGR